MSFKQFSLAFGLIISVLFSTQALATTDTVSVAENPDIGALFPVLGDVITGKADGKKFISVANEIGDSFKAGTNPTFTNVAGPIREWSYSRGVGTIPNECANGYDKSGLLCYQSCPAGYDTVAGVCWQQCPSGYSDGGALCTLWKWWPKTIAKNSFLQNIKGMQCASGMMNEAGLCYTPCADTFTGIGPVCWGSIASLVMNQDRIREQVGAQQASAQTSGGIVIGEGQTPKLKTDMSFTPIVCAIANTEKAFGLPLPGADELAVLAIDAGVGAIKPAAWFNSSLTDTVVLDFAGDARCDDDGVVAKATLNIHPSVTVKASTKQFDPVLHNLAGVDLGVMQISVYELIPFRVYGTVGTTLGIDTTISSTIDRSQPAVLIDGRQHANSTALKLTPEMDFWLSAQAYLRVTSFVSFIPDLVQLGAEFKLWVLELELPYSLEEGVRMVNGEAEMYKTESLAGNLEAGRGYVDTFLKVLGIKTNVFGDEADVKWDGYKTDKTFFNTSETQAVQ